MVLFDCTSPTGFLTYSIRCYQNRSNLQYAMSVFNTVISYIQYYTRIDSRLSIWKILIIVYLYLNTTFLQELRFMTGNSLNTVVDWTNLIQKVMSN